jgi:hypothetical protein
MKEETDILREKLILFCDKESGRIIYVTDNNDKRITYITCIDLSSDELHTMAQNIKIERLVTQDEYKEFLDGNNNIQYIHIKEGDCITETIYGAVIEIVYIDVEEVFKYLKKGNRIWSPITDHKKECYTI